MSDGDVLGISLAYNAVTDYSLKADKVFEINPEQEQYTDPVTLVTAQDLTAAYADFGGEIDCR